MSYNDYFEKRITKNDFNIEYGGKGLYTNDAKKNYTEIFKKINSLSDTEKASIYI